MAIKNPKKFFGIMVFVFAIVAMNFVFSSAVSGLEIQDYMHSNQYYSVTYDSEGDAIVAAKLVLYNTKNEYLRKVALELPSERVVIYNLAQESYENYAVNDVYYKEYYPYYGSIYYPIEYKTERTSSATLLTFYLPIEIEQQKQGTILIFYKIPKSTEIDSLGVHKFDFKTIVDKNAALIQNVRVAVNVQDGLYLKGAKSEVEYKPDFYLTGIQNMEIAKEGSQSQELADFSNRITYEKGLVKNAYNLDPYESFHVKGEFSDSWLKMYFLEILVVVLVIIGIIFAVKKLLCKKFSTDVREIKLFDKKERGYFAIVARTCIFGFFSSVLICLMFFIMMSLIGFVDRGMSYYTSWLIPLFFLLAVIIMIASVFGPVMLVGSRYGILEAILTFVFICLWLFAFMLVVFGFFTYSSGLIYGAGAETASSVGSYPITKDVQNSSGIDAFIFALFIVCIIVAISLGAIMTSRRD